MTSYREIEEGLREAMARALRVEAGDRGLTEPAGVFEQVAADPDRRSDEIRRLFGERPPLALVDFDTPGIQEFIFRVSRPVDLAGGSRLISDFTDPHEPGDVSLYRHLAGLRAAVPPSTVIYAGGGGGLLLVAASEGEALAAAIERILREETCGGLTSVAAVLEVWPEELGSSAAEAPAGLGEIVGKLRRVPRYAATVAALEGRLGRERSRRLGLAEPIPPGGHRARCHPCGLRTARSWRYKGDDDNKELICPSCKVRWRYGCRGKQEDDQPQTFEDLVDGLPDTSLAVLYADGSNVGHAFQQVQSMAQHRALSLAVDAAMESARDAALKACPWLSQPDKKRYQDLLSGGDDLVLILPGMAAFRAIEPLIATFERAFDLKENRLLAGAFGEAPEDLRDRIRGFGLGVGIAVAPSHFPIQFLLDYSRQLLKSAKKRIRDPGRGEARSAVDFEVLRSGTPFSDAIADLRARHLTRESGGGRPGLLLTRRPLSAGEATELRRRADLLGQHVPTTQLHALRQEIGRGPELARSLWRYQHARAKDGAGQEEGWAAYRRDLGCGLADVDRLLFESVPAPAKKNGPWLATDFLDALELFDLLRHPEPKAEGAAT